MEDLHSVSQLRASLAFKWASHIFVVVHSCRTEQDACKISDFGCSEKLEDFLCFQAPLTTQVAHTPIEPYSSWKERPYCSKLTSSFATTFWQMITKEVPHSGEHQYKLYSVVGYNLHPSLSAAASLTPSLGEDLRRLPDLAAGLVLGSGQVQNFSWLILTLQNLNLYQDKLLSLFPFI